ncbi:MAG: DUF5107 domain-containing protein, partial [Oscillospiraceae bacterium]
LPMFRDAAHDKKIASDGTLSAAECAGLGKNTGMRVLPYCMQDRFTLADEKRDYETVVLENDLLKAQFLPGLGGRLYSLFDKEKNRELLFRNPVFQPANLAIRNAWFSGGIEWNTAQTGHAYSTCDHVYCARMEEPEGGAFLRMYDYVRTTGLFWQIDFHLPQGSRFLYAHVRLINDSPEPTPLYWWTNIAVPEEKRVRIFSGTGEVIFINPGSLKKESDIHSYGHTKLPELPSMPGVDMTYPQNSEYTNEYYFQNDSEVSAPWEAAAYEDGFAFMERSTQPLKTRKMFCWGNHSGGRNWMDHLAEPGRGDYVEIQAGLAPTQVHGDMLGAGEKLSFTQAFGSTELDPEKANLPDWYSAKDVVEHQVERALPAEQLQKRHQAYASSATLPCGELLHMGHGWGFVEGARRAAAGTGTLPPELSFPKEAAGPEELRWYGLLTEGTMPPLPADVLPQSWMTDPNWAPYLEQAMLRQPSNGTLPVYLGTLYYENGREQLAIQTWKQALNRAPSVIAHRNLAVAYSRGGDRAKALEHMGAAFALDSKNPHKELAVEYLALLVGEKQYSEAWAVYTALPTVVAEDERTKITACAAALAVGAWDFLDAAFAHSFAVIREGENQMVDLWFRREAQKEAQRSGRTDLAEVERELRCAVTPPKNIDYRLTTA